MERHTIVVGDEVADALLRTPDRWPTPWDTTWCLPELLGTVVHVARCASSWTTATMIITQIASKHDPPLSDESLKYYGATHESWVSFDMHKMYPLERHEQSKEFLMARSIMR